MKATIKEDFIKAISHHGLFTPDDFSFKDVDVQKSILITYEYSNGFHHFKFRVPTSKSAKNYEEYDKRADKVISKTKQIYVFQGFMKPGTFAESEDFTSDDFDQLLEIFEGWLDLLDKELLSTPLKRRLEEQEQRIKEIKEQIDGLFNSKEGQEDLSERFFTREEGELLKAKLDEMETFLSTKIKEEEIPEEQKENDISELNRDFVILKGSTSTMTKKNWLKKFAINVAVWCTDSVKLKRLSIGVKLIENISKTLGYELPIKISGLLPDSEEKIS